MRSLNSSGCLCLQFFKPIESYGNRIRVTYVNYLLLVSHVSIQDSQLQKITFIIILSLLVIKSKEKSLSFLLPKGSFRLVAICGENTVWQSAVNTWKLLSPTTKQKRIGQIRCSFYYLIFHNLPTSTLVAFIGVASAHGLSFQPTAQVQVSNLQS